VRTHSATLFIASLLWTTVAAGDTGLLAGARYWQGDADGSVRYLSNDPANDIDLNRDLGYDSVEAGTYYLRLEHPVPLLPNAMISRTELDDSARGRLSRTVDFGGSSFIVGEDIDSRLQYRQSDIILYYSILDTVANLDIGLDARHVDSTTALSGSGGSTETANVTGWIPLLYAGIGLDLPLTGLSVGADGSFLGYRGHHLYDVTLRASYTSPLRLGADLGYRHLKLGLDDFEGYSADLEFSGPYAGVFVDF
jgi:outer membrane protein